MGALTLGLALVLPNPDGLALDQGDRQQVAFSYRGIAASSPVPAEDADGEIIVVAAQDRTVAVMALDHTVSVRAVDRTILCPARPTP